LSGKYPSKKLAIVACMDVRLDPLAALGLEPGDAHLIRNAGGLVTDDVIRSLAISQHLLGTEVIALIQHTDCGMQAFSDEELTERLEQHAGEPLPFKPGAFADLEENLRESVRLLEESPFLLTTDQVTGYIYDVETGQLRELST
jgi:carbonic anhydrase